MTTDTSDRYETNDVIRTRTGKCDRVIIGVKLQHGGCFTHPGGCVASRSLRNGRPFGPSTHNAVDTFTLIRKAGHADE